MTKTWEKITRSHVASKNQRYLEHPNTRLISDSVIVSVALTTRLVPLAQDWILDLWRGVKQHCATPSAPLMGL